MSMSDLPNPGDLLPPTPNDASVQSEVETIFNQLEGKNESVVLLGDAGAQAEGSPSSSAQADASSAPQGQPALPYGTLQRWSVLLGTVPPVHRIKLLRELPTALTRGDFQAVRLKATLTHEYQDAGGQPQTLTVPDEAIRYTSKLHKWITAQVKEHVYELLTEQEHLQVDFEQLTSGELDFKRLVKLQRDKEALSSKPAAKAAKPTGSGAGTSRSNSTRGASPQKRERPQARSAKF
jgi:hypothetical protein